MAWMTSGKAHLEARAIFLGQDVKVKQQNGRCFIYKHDPLNSKKLITLACGYSWAEAVQNARDKVDGPKKSSIIPVSANRRPR